MPRNLCNLAVIGFEHYHHLPAFHQALGRLQENHRVLTPRIWSAPTGLKQDINDLFLDCTFIDSWDMWHGVLDLYVCDNNYKYPSFKLSKLELKHLSYTKSRLTFFRDPAFITPSDIKYFNKLCCFAIKILDDHEVDIAFFSKIPHSLGELAFYYASKYLGIKYLWTDNPYFMGDYVRTVLPYEQLYRPPELIANFNVEDLASSIYSTFLSRDLNQTLKPPAYTTESLDYMPNAATSVEPVYRYSLPQKFYSIVPIPFLARLIAKLLITAGSCSSVLNLNLIKLFSGCPPLQPKKYILYLLHYHPEATTSPTSLDTPFEHERINTLRRLFPDHAIVIREHPSNCASGEYFQHRPFYRYIPFLFASNVFFLFPTKDRKSYKALIKNAYFTISTSGTVVFESVMMGTPSVHLSKGYSKLIPGSINLDNVNALSAKTIDESAVSIADFSAKDFANGVCKDLKPFLYTKGFLNGYHACRYSSKEYIDNADLIVYNSLLLSLSNPV